MFPQLTVATNRMKVPSWMTTRRHTVRSLQQVFTQLYCDTNFNTIRRGIARHSTAGQRIDKAASLHDSSSKMSCQDAALSALLQDITSGASDISGTFCCGGVMNLRHPVHFSCFDAEGKLLPNLIPIPTSGEVTDPYLEDLVGKCYAATFGKGSEAVLDLDYRKALAMGPSSFDTSFRLESYGVLDTVREVMVPSAAGVTAELYKLNVYRAGDFFKAHVDTPRGENMFGTLVVCLPQPHSGGELVVRHKKESKVHDWAASIDPGQVQWVAFYSDCEHEILPVKSGHRITLTYNLYHSKSSGGPFLPCLSPSSTTLYTKLVKACSVHHFLPDGGALAFACEHAYPHTSESTYNVIPSLLKGGDAILYAVATELGLRASVKAVYDLKKVYNNEDEYEDKKVYNNEDEYEDEGQDGMDGMDLHLADPSELYTRIRWSDPWDEDGECKEDILNDIKGLLNTKDVRWCRLPDVWSVQIVSASYGPRSESFFSAAAILVHIPAWGSRERNRICDMRP